MAGCKVPAIVKFQICYFLRTHYNALMNSLLRIWLFLCLASMAPGATGGSLMFEAGSAKLSIERTPIRIEAAYGAAVAAAAHPEGSLLLGDPDHLDRAEAAAVTAESFDQHGNSVLSVATAQGRTAKVTVMLTPNQADFVVRPGTPMAVLLRFQGAAPGFGLADHAVTGRASFDTDVTGYVNDRYLSGEGLTRLVSNFIIYPKQHFAFLVWEPAMKIVRSTAVESTQGARLVEGEVRFTIFLGTPKEIYRQFLRSRNQYGYPVLRPKYEFFGVGWEAFGALAWDTNDKTVKENVDRYLTEGYPLKWMVVGSGFWPKEGNRFHETTSFGMYDKTLYPDPAGFIRYFHSRGLKFFQGLRTTFITDGPYSEEGLRDRYFIEENGKAKVFTFGWPKSPIYFLDALKPQAVEWFTELVKKWDAYGVDGYKEDVYGFGKYTLRDDKLDSFDHALMDSGHYIMGRNAYLTSSADLHRINDFNYNQNQDRGPVNALACAYAGFPLVYPDIVGGTFGEGHFDLKVTPRMRIYMMRNAQWAAVHSSMSMGQGPWTFEDAKVSQVMLSAAKLHDRLQPYIYSQALRFYLEGYPWTMAPLPVAFPDDQEVYGRENDRVRGYEWMIGDALLATPLYGNDYETANSRDIYLPRGTWIDYDTGTRYSGPRMLKNFSMPPEKTPLFVGGTGITVEKRGSQVLARVYPLGAAAETTIYFRDGQSRIRVAAIGSSRLSSNHLSVQTDSGSHPQGAWRRNAFEFIIEPGENYEVR
jgi:alpha-glucosidase (family GH31 glycosyl hydrolase)